MNIKCKKVIPVAKDHVICSITPCSYCGQDSSVRMDWTAGVVQLVTSAFRVELFQVSRNIRHLGKHCSCHSS